MSLPHDRASVPLTRRVLDAALAMLSVTRECRDEIGLAVGEACANAVQHGEAGTGYDVVVMIKEDRCVIEVVDGGSGVDTVDHPPPGPGDESGRGLPIIRALADVVEPRRLPHGSALRIVKSLARYAALA
jgi:serine/threonine-protein kinase RsbW